MLKLKIISRTTESEQRRVQRLLTEEELGDRKPSQLLRSMEQLLVGDKRLENGILRHLFLQRLPQNVRLNLASTGESPALYELAALADRILEAHVPAVNAVAHVTDAASHAITLKPTSSGDYAQVQMLTL